MCYYYYIVWPNSTQFPFFSAWCTYSRSVILIFFVFLPAREIHILFFMFFVILLLHRGYKYVYYMMRQLDCNRTARKKKDHDSWDHSEKISGLMIMPASERDGEKNIMQCNVASSITIISSILFCVTWHDIHFKREREFLKEKIYSQVKKLNSLLVWLVI